MQTTLGTTLRLLASSAACLCSLILFDLAAPECAAVGTGPTITSATITPSAPNTLPVDGDGGVITVTATVTDADGPVTGVKATVSLNSAYYDPSDDRRNDTISLYNSGGNVYTGTIPSTGANTSTAPFTYSATVTASDANLSSTVVAMGQCVQLNDDSPPVISASIGPATLAAIGGSVIVTATVIDPGNRPITSVKATVSLNSAYYDPSDDRRNDTISLYNNTGSNVYTGSIPSSGNNTGATFNYYTATVSATNNLSLTNTVTATGQTTQINTADTQPQSSHTHLLWQNTSGLVAVYTIGSDRTYTQKLYGPYPGWTAKAVSDGPDGVRPSAVDSQPGRASLAVEPL